MTQPAAWLFWTFVAAVIALVNAYDVVGGTKVNEWLLGEAGAAWFQALGSVAAILIAVWVAKRQNDHQLAAEAAKESERICGFALLVEQLAEAMELAPRLFEVELAINHGGGVHSCPSESRELRELLRNIESAESALGYLVPVNALHSEAVLGCLQKARKAAARSKNALVVRRPMWPDNPNLNVADDDLNGSIRELWDVARTLRQEAQRVRDQHG